MECGGKHSATPLSHDDCGTTDVGFPTSPDFPQSGVTATALQDHSVTGTIIGKITVRRIRYFN